MSYSGLSTINGIMAISNFRALWQDKPRSLTANAELFIGPQDDGSITALSRVRRCSDSRVLFPESQQNPVTLNVVYKDLLL